MFDLANRLLNGNHPVAIGVSFGGPVDYETHTVRLSHHVPGWEDFPLSTILQEKFQCNTSVDNDANVAALGEFVFGAGKNCNSLLYITVSTGVGGGWILDHKIWHGAGSMAGEIGHTVVDPLGPTCLCGKQGCVERLASGPYLAQDARLLLSQDLQQGLILRELANRNLDSITAQLISQAAALGDTLSISLLNRAAHAIGVGIGNAANLINPQRFILGGGVTKSGEQFWQTIRKTARRIALPQVQIEILPAALADDAPLWGAVALADQWLSNRS
jgi:glucokinase